MLAPRSRTRSTTFGIVLGTQTDVAQALVELGADGEVTRVQVPTRVGERAFKFPRPVSAQEVDNPLRQRARLTLAKKQ